MGSDDMNGDPCIIPSSGFFLEKFFVMEFSKQDVVVAEAVSLMKRSRFLKGETDSLYRRDSP